MKQICQNRLPILPWMDPKLRRLPGVQPLGAAPWLWRDEVFDDQMTYRDSLLADHRADVYAATERCKTAARELLDLIAGEVARDQAYQISPDRIRRPDGVDVDLHGDAPLVIAGRLVQEDLLVMQRVADEHILTGGILCFPASWTLGEKLGRGLAAIHNPVAPYDAGMARRVQRLLDGIQVTLPVWRANYLLYEDPELFQPRREGESRGNADGSGKWVRVERQTLRRLPETDAIVFGIHTFVASIETLDPVSRAALLQEKAENP